MYVCVRTHARVRKSFVSVETCVCMYVCARRRTLRLHEPRRRYLAHEHRRLWPAAGLSRPLWQTEVLRGANQPTRVHVRFDEAFHTCARSVWVCLRDCKLYVQSDRLGRWWRARYVCMSSQLVMHVTRGAGFEKGTP
jgi:hypothetical protein